VKKITPYILIFFIFVNLFAPVSLELNSEKINVNKNIANAADPSGGSIKLKGYITKTDTTITVYAAVNFETNNWRTGNEKAVVIISDSANKIVTFKDNDGNIVNATVMEVHNINDGTAVIPTEIKNAISDSSTTIYYKKVFTGLTPSTAYNISLYASHQVMSWWTIAAASAGTAVGIASIIITAGATAPLVIAAGTAIAGGSAIAVGQTINVKNDENTVIMDPPEITVTTNTAGDSQNKVASSNITASNSTTASNMPACSMNPVTLGSGTPMGCVAQGIYYVLFQSTSYLFALSGTLFDNAFAYSVDDNSYRSAFVVEGWKVVRDFCNMFFIFILLYIAFGTILNLNGVKTKEMIINVVLIGIFINFSLFASQVIIDASNILARVFYNSNTITVKIEDAAVGSNVIPLSAALVNKINPQQIILNANQVDMVKDTRGKSGSDTGEVTTSNGISTGTFILVTILATIVNLVGVFVFLSVSLVFVARVIGLWLSMIFVPFAFLSYTVPAMQSFEIVGWKRWWPDTLKMAFLAPVFIFFIYLILQFLETGLGLVKTDATAGGLSFMIGIIFPFAIIMILLLKAKDIATKMSGTIGETISKAGSAVGGLALGAATGGAALMARGSLGQLGNRLANSDSLKASEAKGGVGGFMARNLRNIGTSAAKGSFDVRATKLGGITAKATGMDLGKAQGAGGYEKRQADITAKRRERAESIKLGDQTPQVKELHHTEEELSNLKNDSVNDTNRIDGTLAAKRLVGNDLYQKLTAANTKAAKAKVDMASATTDEEKEVLQKIIDDATQAQKEFDDNAETISDYTKERIDLNNSTGKYSHKTGNGKVNKKGFDDYKANVVDKSAADIVKANADMLSATTAEDRAKIQEKLNKATNLNEESTKIFEEMEAAGKAHGFTEEDEKVHSISELALKMIPELHHKVEKENADRVNEYAASIRNRLFNKVANDRAAHEAIMRSEIKKH